MIDVVVDLHLHGKYSRAVSPQMTPEVMAEVGAQKGINVLATGDWTHPLWMRELRSQLEEAEEGLYKLKEPKGTKEPNEPNGKKGVRFLLSVEISCIYSQGGKGRRIHNLVFVPSFETAEKVNKELVKRGCNLSSDGRPIVGLSSKNLLQLLLEIDERSLLIPAHIWTPWFGIYGQMSGFNSLEEAFGELAPHIYGIETGLSSDPEMNWQIDELDARSILSFSDAHSLAKMGREATVFRLERLSYENIRAAIMQPSKVYGSEFVVRGKSTMNNELTNQLTQNRVLYTVEFYPEEGKYHYSGHRNCHVTMTPKEQEVVGGICPVCKRKLTDGVMRRVKELADKDSFSEHTTNQQGLVWIKDSKQSHPPFVKIVPLNEIIAEAIGSPVSSPKVQRVYDSLTAKWSELDILLKVPIGKIGEVKGNKPFDVAQGKKISEGIDKVRREQLTIVPGYDGMYGVVYIWDEGSKESNESEGEEKKKEQIGLEF